MKEKILFLIIGILIGAIITTAGFLIYTKVANSNQPKMMQMNENGAQMDKPPSNSNMEEPPEKTNGAKNNQSLIKPENTNNNA